VIQIYEFVANIAVSVPKVGWVPVYIVIHCSGAEDKALFAGSANSTVARGQELRRANNSNSSSPPCKKSASRGGDRMGAVFLSVISILPPSQSTPQLKEVLVPILLTGAKKRTFPPAPIQLTGDAVMAEEGVPPVGSEGAHHAAAMAGIKKAQEENQRQRLSSVATQHSKIVELLRDAHAQMAEADFTMAAVSCAQARALDPNGTSVEMKEIDKLEIEAEHKRTSQELVRRGINHMNARDYHTAVKDFDGVLLLIVDPGELRGLEASLTNDTSLVSGTIDINALALHPLYVIELREQCKRKQKARELQKLGEIAFEAQDWAKAVELFLEALSYDPDNAQIKDEEVLAEKYKRSEELKKLGDTQAVAEQFEDALGAYRTALSLNPNDEELPPRIESTEKKVRAMQLKRQGIDQLNARDYAGAVVSFDSALDLWPEHDHAELVQLRDEAARKVRALELRRQAQSELASDRPDEAVRLLKEALALWPDNAEIAEEERVAERKARALVLMNEGAVQAGQHLFIEAVQTFILALDLDPDNRNIQSLKEDAERKAEAMRLDALGDAQRAADHLDEAIEKYREALTFWPDNEEIRAKIEALLAEQQRRIEAAHQALLDRIAELYRQAQYEMSTGDGQSWDNQEAAAGNYMQCSLLCAQAEDLDRERVYPADGRAAIGALASCAEGKIQAQNWVRTGREQAAALDYKAAVASLDKAIKFDHEHEPIKLLRQDYLRMCRVYELQYQGEMQMSKGHNDKAVHKFLEALTLDPDNKEIKEEEIMAEKRLKLLDLIKQGDAQTEAGQLLLDAKMLVIMNHDGFDISAERRAGVNTKLVEAERRAKLAANKDGILALIRQAEMLLKSKALDVASVLKTLNDAHATEFSAALATYRAGDGLVPGDAEIPPRLQSAQNYVDALQLKLTGIHEMNAQDYPGAIGTFDSALNLWPHNQEIKWLRDMCDRKRRALELKRQAEEAMEAGDNAKADDLFVQALALDPDNEEIRKQEASVHKAHASGNLRGQADAHTQAGRLLLDAKLNALDLERDPNDVHARKNIKELLARAADKAVEADMQDAKPSEATDLLGAGLPGARTSDGCVAMWLEKKSPSIFKGWQKRWFVFHPSGEMAYFSDEKEKEKKKSSLMVNQCTWITSNNLAHGHFELHFSGTKTVELRVLDKQRESVRPIEHLMKCYFAAGALAVGCDGLIHEETLDDKTARMGPTMHLIESAEQQLDANDVAGLLSSLEEAHTREYEQALTLYRTASVLNPDDETLKPRVDSADNKVSALAQKRQGVHELAARDYSGAVQTLTAALALFPDNGEIKLLLDEATRKARAQELRRLAEAEITAEHFEKAIELLKEALALDPNNTQLEQEEQDAENKLQASKLKVKGLRELEQENFAAAAATFGAAIELDADDEELPELKKIAEAKLKARELATQATHEFDNVQGFHAEHVFTLFDHALALDSENADIRASRDSCQAELDRRLAAVIMQIGAFHTQASDDLAAGRYADCITKCESAIALDETDKDGHTARVYQRRLDLDVVFETAKHRHQAQQLLARAREQMGVKDYDGAVASLDEALGLHPDNEDIKTLRDEAARKALVLKLQREGEAALSHGENAKACELLLQALAADPDNADIKAEEALAEKHKKADELKILGDNQATAAEFQAALVSYQSALALNSDDADLPTRIVEVTKKIEAKQHQQNGQEAAAARDFAAAVHEFDLALALWPDNEEIKSAREATARKLKAQQLLADSRRLLAEGKTEDAVRALQQALALDANNAVIKDADVAAERLLRIERLKTQAVSQMKSGEFAEAVRIWLELRSMGSSALTEADEALKQEAESKASGQKLGAQAALQLAHDQVDQAIATYDRALTQVPSSTNATDDNRLHIELVAAREAALRRKADDLAKYVESLLDKARRLLQAGDEDGALVCVRSAMAADPENAQALALEREVAERKRKEDDVQGLLARGEKEMIAGNNSKAMGYFEHALQLIDELDQNDSEDKAVADRDIANVNEAMALQTQGQAQCGAHEYERGKDSFQKALAIEPENPALQELLKEAIEDAAKWSKASELEDEGITLFNADPQDLAGAVAKFEQALEAWPHDLRALEWLGRCREAEKAAAAAAAAAEEGTPVEEQKAIDVTIKTEENKALIQKAA
jgi:tetratricopeptide (TPR) repeat protein